MCRAHTLEDCKCSNPTHSHCRCCDHTSENWALFFPSAKSYARHFICVTCRKGYKKPWEVVKVTATDEKTYHSLECPFTCGTCSEELMEVSRDFRIPKRNDNKAWSVMSAIAKGNSTIIMDEYCGGPRHLRTLVDFM